VGVVAVDEDDEFLAAVAVMTWELALVEQEAPLPLRLAERHGAVV
jgi:hypothetical protein